MNQFNATMPRPNQYILGKLAFTDIKIPPLPKLTGFLRPFKKLIFGHKTLGTGRIARYNKSLRSSLLKITDFRDNLQTLKISEPLYLDFKNEIYSDACRVYEFLEKDEFLNSSETKKLITSFIEVVLDIEFQLRKTVYKHTNKPNDDDKELMDFASKMSLSSAATYSDEHEL